MRLTIIYILLISVAGTILYFTENYEIEQEKAETEIKIDEEKVRQAIILAKEKRQDSILSVILQDVTADSIDLSNLDLTTVPDILLQFTQLKYLNLSNNKLTEIHFRLLLNLDKLERLDISNNALTTFPVITNFNHASLQSINLNNNKLTNIIITSSTLEYLDISSNKINIDVLKIYTPNLNTLNICNNPFKSLSDFTYNFRKVGLKKLITNQNVICNYDKELLKAILREHLIVECI